MNYILVIIIAFFFQINQDTSLLQGKWKLETYDAFLIVQLSEQYKMGSDKQKEEMDKVFNFTLDNTYFEFKGDTIIMDDAVNNKVERKVGIYHVEDDKITINRIGKIHSKEYRLISVSEYELVLALSYSDGQKDIHATFRRVN
jgi:hypothetical protein